MPRLQVPATVTALFVAWLLSGPSAGLAVSQAQPTLNAVLTRAGEYAVRYGEELATVLAEEAYTQELVSRAGGATITSRRLRSEIAFIRLNGSTEWWVFRNVLTIDESPVPESAGRLERLFHGVSQSFIEQARAITAESARYNLGPLNRQINVPTIALHFIHPEHRANSRFEKEGEQYFDGERVWVVAFREERGLLIRRSDGRSLAARGRLWIAPSDGRVVRSELVVKDFVRGEDSEAVIDVSWRRDAGLDLWVPAEMRERYVGPWSVQSAPKRRERYDIAGVATYSNYRRFSVDVRIR